MKGFGQAYKEAQAATGNAQDKLPVGGYVIRILDVREENYSGGGSAIVLRYDIAEGEYKGFFQKNYDAQSNFDKQKWKGIHRLFIPQENDEKFRKRLGFFKSQIQAFEETNHVNINCAVDWDPHILKGLLVGAVFGNKEYDYNGYSGFYTNLDHLVPAECIRTGDFVIPKDRLLKRQTIPAQSQQNSADFSEFEEIISDGDVPF